MRITRPRSNSRTYLPDGDGRFPSFERMQRLHSFYQFAFHSPLVIWLKDKVHYQRQLEILFAALLRELVKYSGLQNHQGINSLLPKPSLGNKFSQIPVKKHKATVYVPDEKILGNLCTEIVLGAPRFLESSKYYLFLETQKGSLRFYAIFL